MEDFPLAIPKERIPELLQEVQCVWDHGLSLDQRSPSDLATRQSVEPPNCSCDFRFEATAGTLGLTIPGLEISQFNRWLGHRLVWIPRQADSKRTIGIVSSRLGERLDLRRTWFDALRTAIIRIDSETEQLCVARGTAIEEIVLRAAELFDVPVLSLKVAAGTVESVDNLADWVTSLESDASSSVLISPEVSQPDASPRSIPDVDAVAALCANRVVTLSCRAGGHVESSIQRRLKEGPRGTVLVLQDPSLTSARTFESLVGEGAVPWILAGCDNPTNHPEGRDEELKSRDRSFETGPLTAPDEWLCHWTRPRSGPWPDETSEDHLDALILGCDSADHSAFAAVVRIAETGRLFRTAFSKNCVSLTEVPLKEFRSRRTYRRHLRRYDFESWGVAIRKCALVAIGAEPVRYVDEDAVNVESADHSWTVHPRQDRSGLIDWSLEREWRVPADVRLTDLNHEDVVFFVDTEIEANRLRKLVEWPVIVVPADSDGENQQKNGK